MIRNTANSTSAAVAKAVLSAEEAAFGEFSFDVRKGLTASPKTLPPKYFYDELGSILFQAICRLPEYYVTRDEDEILRSRADEIVRECGVVRGSTVNLIELGSGTSEKTRHLIHALLRLNTSLYYRAIDVSSESLKLSEKELHRAYPTLRFVPYPNDYLTALQQVARDLSFSNQRAEINIGLFLGSSIGNLERDEAESLLRAVRRVLRPRDSFIIGVDLKKSTSVLLTAYNDALGITAAFNLNLLVRINRELGGNFDLDKFDHRAIFNEECGRIEMHLVSREKQTVEIRALGLKVSFDENETIHTENSYKFDLNTFSAIVNRAGFRLTKTWLDSHRRFSLNRLEPHAA